MIVAIFGDVHGNLSGMYNLCQEWTEKAKRPIDLVLQTGDMGLFRSPEELDKTARKRLAAGDRSQLDAANYFTGERMAPIETWFCHGNHDNFPLLAAHENQAVDPGERLIFLGPGALREFRKGTETLRVAALGGIEYRFGKHPLPSPERIQKYLHPTSAAELMRTKPPMDILLTHDAPFNKGLRTRFPTGSQRLTQLIEMLQPRFAFYGHYDDPPEPFRLGATLCVGMNQRTARHIPERDGAMGILDTERGTFTFVSS